MNNRHLTDEQIQEILDAELLQAGSVLPLHLGSCAGCRKRLESFQELYAGLAADPGFALPPAFAESVLDRLPASPRLFWERPTTKIALASAAGAVILAALILFVNMRPLANGTLQGIEALKAAFLPLSGQLKQFLSWLGGNAKPFLLGGLGLFAAFVFDRFLLQQSVRHGH